jgi:hypothetical protein
VREDANMRAVIGRIVGLVFAALAAAGCVHATHLPPDTGWAEAGAPCPAVVAGSGGVLILVDSSLAHLAPAIQRTGVFEGVELGLSSGGRGDWVVKRFDARTGRPLIGCGNRFIPVVLTLGLLPLLQEGSGELHLSFAPAGASLEEGRTLVIPGQRGECYGLLSLLLALHDDWELGDGNASIADRSARHLVKALVEAGVGERTNR